MLLDRIELFVNVAKHQNLAKTARGMHVSPSSVSQRLKSLENDFGVKLYKKNKQGIELTTAGHKLLTTASQVLNQLDTLRRTLNPQSDTPIQTLTIGATYNPSAREVPSAIAAFQKNYPDIKVRFLTAYRRTVEKWVRDGEVDIALIQNPSESCMADLFTEHFAVDSLAFCASPSHPLARKQRVSLADLAKVPLVVREGTGTTQKMLSLLTSRGLTLNVALRCASPDAVKAAVRNKMGVGILFHRFIEDDIKRKEIKVFRVAELPKLVASSYIVYQKTQPLTVPASEFLTLLRTMKPSAETI
jgi:LysR family transcriptional regulator, transcriptional activator of the cysJI operon